MNTRKTNQHICPVCKQHEFSEDFDFCPVCGWCNDRVQENNPNMEGAGNHMSLNQAKKAWTEGKEIE